jgi:RNA polymerase sigma-54 factor
MTNFELKNALKQKQNLQLFMKQWLPILQNNLEELQTYLSEISEENPYLEVKSSFEVNFRFQKNFSTNMIEVLTSEEESLYEKLNSQILAPLFPTPISVKIAKEIIENINEEGYFEGDVNEIAKKFNVDGESVEKVRLRFAYIEPSGIGAKDLAESFLFQLNEFELDEELYELLVAIINDFVNMDKYIFNPRFSEAKIILKKFKNPPAIEYLINSREVIPEMFVEIKDDEINIKVNDKFYPDIKIKEIDINDPYAKEKVREAQNIEKLLTLRKTTLYRICLKIIEKQLRFFYGGDLIPLKLQDIADELEFNESTISRAISNKYIASERGVFALKDFFSTAISSTTSSSEIKNFINSLITYENKQNPLTDQQIADIIEKKYLVKLIRRSITKYRQELNIASSLERKKFYLIENA